jgi:hypothetical protein
MPCSLNGMQYFNQARTLKQTAMVLVVVVVIMMMMMILMFM